ncbi:hypothetical protein B0H12DRAFT_1080581 [Mycena haematopus]|nr:hypothetical protein B0H12DRAFT_1080581 [Mycena haematopus]
MAETYARDCAEEAGALQPTFSASTVAPSSVADTTLTPHTWVLPKRGLNKLRVAFVLSQKKLLVAVDTDLGYGQASRCIEVQSSRPLQIKDYQPLEPTPSQLAPFLHNTHPDLEKLPFTGHCQALGEGDRVVVIMANTRGKPVEKSYNGVKEVSKKNVGLYIELVYLRRHLLDIHSPIRVHDRVRVVGGIFYRDTSGRVQEIDGHILTVAVAGDEDIVGPTTPSQLSTGKVFNIDMRYVHRDFRPGDAVSVQRGQHQGRVGFIVAVCTGGAVEIFEVCFQSRSALHAVDHVFTKAGNADSFRVRAADVEWDQRTNTAVGPSESYTLPAIAAAEELSKQDQDNLVKLMHTGQRFVGIDVRVVGKSIHKGFRGVVVGDHDSPQRARRLRKQTRYAWDYGGIIVTIQKEASNTKVDVPIEQLNHLYTNLTLIEAAFLPKDVLESYELSLRQALYPPAPPARTPSPPPSTGPLWTEGEDTGEWMCFDALAGKRFDVQLVGTRVLRSNKVSDTVRKLDGSFGYVLPAAAISSTSQKVEVVGLGKNRTKHPIAISCIKPRRVDDNGRPLTEICTRVVIVGPDADLSSNIYLGRYALTVPELVHPHGENAVGVKFERGGPGEEHPTAVFYTSSLCMAKNDHIQAVHGIFESTNFE